MGRQGGGHSTEWCVAGDVSSNGTSGGVRVRFRVAINTCSGL